jgi:hypothetical protein
MRLVNGVCVKSGRAADYIARSSVSRRSAMHIMPHINSTNFSKSILLVPFIAFLPIQLFL